VSADRLRRQIAYARRNSLYYRERLRDAKTPPLLSRAELEEHFERLLCVPRERWADVSRTSGSSGRPLHIPVTLREMRRLLGSVAAGVAGMGVRAGDRVCILLPMDDMMNPTVMLEQVFRDRLRCLVIRVGARPPEQQLDRVLALRPNVVVGAPSPFLKLGMIAQQNGVDPRALGIERAVLMGQPLYGEGWRPNVLKERLDALWGAELFSIYGSTELYAGLSECSAHRGHHVLTDDMLVEIVDPESGQVLEEGVGEVVVTTLSREALPLIRYRTGDLSWLERESCACGLDSPRVMAVLGRTDEMLKIKGAKIYPQQVEDLVAAVEGVEGHVLEVYVDAHGQELLRLRVAVRGDGDAIVAQIRERVRAYTRVTPEVEVAHMDEVLRRWMAHGGRKPRKFHDLRGARG